jgi:hypothetical protein
MDEILNAIVNGEEMMPWEEPTFEPGTVVVFEPNNFNPSYWNALSEEDRVKYYGALGYGQKKKKFFVFLCEIKNAPGHCVLVSLDDQKIETMRHTDNFREVDEEEF